MTNIKYVFVLFIVFYFPNATAQPTAFDIEHIVMGDLNNDKITDTAFVKGPKFLNESDGWGDCTNGDCKITVSFSCDMPNISLPNAVSGSVENIGDIDDDGIAEIIIVPSWFVGCWGEIHFFTLKNKRWKEIGKARTNICREESYRNRIKKTESRKIKVTEELLIDGDVVEKTKIISVR